MIHETCKDKHEEINKVNKDNHTNLKENSLSGYNQREVL